MVTTIYMVRHAESPFIFGEEKTRGLSPRGREAANKVTEVLKDKKIDRVISSPYTRAIETVREVAENRQLQITTYENLKERPIKGLDYRADEKEILSAIEQSFKDENYCLVGGESTVAAQERSIPVIKEILNNYMGESIVIGTHGNIMTIIMNYFQKQFDFQFFQQTTKPDIYEMVFAEEKLLTVNRLWGNGHHEEKQ